MKSNSELSTKQRAEIIAVLKERFEKNLNRHNGVEWTKLQAALEANVEKLWSLNEMEITGGEPDTVGYDSNLDEYVFFRLFARDT